MPAGLSIDVSYSVGSLTVQFTSTAVGYNPNEWSWEFGDGEYSAEENPSHTYSTAGTYTIYLEAAEVDGETSTWRSDDITVTVTGDSTTETTTDSNTCVKTVPPYRWRAKLLGDLCLCAGYAVGYSVDWSGDYPPFYSIVDDEIIIYRRDDNKDEAGVMTITAKLKDETGVVVYTSNEIYLVITSASYYSYTSSSSSTNIGGWLRVPDNYAYTSANGSMGWYGGLDGSVGAYSNNTLTLTFDNIPFTKLWVYSNDGGSGYYKVNGGSSRYYNRGAFSPPWQGGSPIDISGLSSIELHTDGYGSPIYIFGK